MLSNEETVRISKFLSLVLRHRPDKIGISLDENGWTDVQELIRKAGAAGVQLSPDVLQEVVETNNKKRFAFNERGDMIRANQGHSVSVELGYQAKQPPEILYHGTALRVVDSIKVQGLIKQKRHHVHLSPDVDTAVSVGRRHGKPFVYTVQAGQMYRDGYTFYQSANGVWLTEEVPPRYLQPTSY
ncbi:RNA 2'-phosphotransferase [Telluribacter sp. SYSU D00476]|uniref:RNA 2'-phosphotransferase n=1 Tax=Telluribacter sp. SYSU D00476 TaxID=2811430 RepID=UPI001FF6BCA0|nr:RNA 2'-phosphotransferase [Telluribacter sp. SYSU D00476]